MHSAPLADSDGVLIVKCQCARISTITTSSSSTRAAAWAEHGYATVLGLCHWQREFGTQADWHEIDGEMAPVSGRLAVTLTVGSLAGFGLLVAAQLAAVGVMQVQVQENKHHISSLHNTSRQLPARSH